ncbi:uncharacterized protein [Primulina huaijiensis]|uniref:uncharacterized protein n=1 Tax=Primulina huaijiensis TaxID=1492673 RepID=UPI003CC72D4F
MPLTLLESSFFPISPTTTFTPNRKSLFPNVKLFRISCRCRPDEKDDSSRKIENHLAKLALVAMTAGILTLGSVDPAAAAKTGGRIGGQAFKSAPPPRSAGPRINNSRTNVFINPPVAPPLVGGYGYGLGVPFYGGWGWSPFSFFAPGPSVAVGVGGGLDVFVLFIVLGAVSAVLRRFFRSKGYDEDDEY